MASFSFPPMLNEIIHFFYFPPLLPRPPPPPHPQPSCQPTPPRTPNRRDSRDTSPSDMDPSRRPRYRPKTGSRLMMIVLTLTTLPPNSVAPYSAEQSLSCAIHATSHARPCRVNRRIARFSEYDIQTRPPGVIRDYFLLTAINDLPNISILSLHIILVLLSSRTRGLPQKEGAEQMFCRCMINAGLCMFTEGLVNWWRAQQESCTKSFKNDV